MKGFVKISYTGRVKEGPVFDTTNEKIARENGIFDEKRVYTALPVITGEKQVIQGLDEALEKMKPGDKKKVEISQEKGYGKRDPNLIRLVSRGVFKKQGITPIPGMTVELDGRHARIQTVSGGRVRVDFNHELAGRTLIFDVKIEKKAKDTREKILYLVERSFNNAEGFKIDSKAKEVEITIPEKAYRDRGIIVRKASLAAEIFRYLKRDVIFKEFWKQPPKKR